MIVNERLLTVCLFLIFVLVPTYIAISGGNWVMVAMTEIVLATTALAAYFLGLARGGS